tara:strand:- start:4323 stop:4943 length:621 start_codon:yes stop_codon:yes gene_type:complete
MAKSKSVSNVQAICLYPDKTIREFKITPSIDVNKIDYNKISSTVFRSRGQGDLSREVDFKWSGDTLSVYCWTEGKESSINQHDMPPPIDNNLYYGEIIVIRHSKGVLKNISKDDYESFYEDAFGGFENLGSEDSWSSEEEISDSDSIHQFIVSDSENICENSEISESEEEAESSEEEDSENHSLELSTDSSEKNCTETNSNNSSKD